MKDGERPINKSLIVITFLFISFIASAELMEPVYRSVKGAVIIWIANVIFSPVFVLWMKALWNNVIPRITGWKEINFWEAFGVLVFLYLINP
ncbi:MAG: hypothetical protein GY795_46615 [Desulfobacterales bacterium]|nr:hypothetical protein [Desulfobacterales bacterium]